MSISGFIEWLPDIKEVEKSWIDGISDVFSQNGFVSIETASVELLKDLETKGEIDKEIYILDKLVTPVKHKMALHYDLTIPAARYIAENYGSLNFPFKRQQIQKVWRGERPQFGRYREFYQADLDIIDNGDLSLFYDAEVLALGLQAMLTMGIPDFEIGVSNRKIYESYLLGAGITEPVLALRIIDKLDKIGEEKVSQVLMTELGLDEELVKICLLPSRIKLTLNEVSKQKITELLPVQTEQLEQGILELIEVITYVKLLIPEEKHLKKISVDFSFVRGFEYYTGTIFEGKFTESNDYGSICSGGRYDNLTQGFTKQKLPGVGFSIGVTRILAYLQKYHEERLQKLIPKSYKLGIILEDNESSQKLLQFEKNGLQEKVLDKQNLSTRVFRLHCNNLKKGLKKAHKQGFTAVLFLRDNQLILKRMSDGHQEEITTL